MTWEASLPLLYASWLHAVAGGPIPGETKATCDRCAMLPSPGSDPEAVYFHPATKCCAYQPSIPNFLAGAILSDPDPSIAEGREALSRHIARRIAITPSHADAYGTADLLYRSMPHAFGRAPALRCSYLTPAGGCGVWKHRPGVCATWFCKHVRGETGFSFWRLAERLLRVVEQELSLWCLAELEAASAEVVQLVAKSTPNVSELGGEMDWAAYRKLWGAWAGREIELYQACARLVAPLGWKQVVDVCGPRVRVLAGLVRDAYAHLGSDAIPDRLRLGDVQLGGIDGSSYRMVAYSEYDPVLMPERLLRVLHYFEGRTTEEALVAILGEQGIRVAPSLVRRMVDFGILRPCEPKSRSLPVVD